MRTRFLELNWYVTSHRFPTEAAARRAWECLMDSARSRSGELGLGVYRHGTTKSGMVFVTALGLDEDNVEVARQILGGEQEDLDLVTTDALIARRVRVMAELEQSGAFPGAYSIERAKPVTMHRDGTMEDDRP